MFHVGELPGERPAFGSETWIQSHSVTALVWRSPGLSGEETALDSLSPEVRLLPQVTAAGQLLDRDSVIQPPGEGVLSVWRQALGRNGLEIYRRVLERMPGVLSRREGLRSVADRFRQMASQRVPERILRMASVFREVPAEPQSVPGSILADTRLILTPSVSGTARLVPAQSALEPHRPTAARDSRTFWRQILGKAYTAVSGEVFRDISTVRVVPAGGSGALRFIPALHKEQLPSGAITFVRETQIDSNGISFLHREGPVREFTGHTPEAYPAEGYTFEEYTAPDGLPPEVRLLPQPTASERAIYRVSGLLVPGSFGETVRTVHWQGPARGGLTLYRQLVKRSLQEVRKQLIERMPPEAYQQVIERSAPEVYRQFIEQSAPEVYRQVIERSAPEVYRRVIKRSAPEVYRRVIERSAPEVYRQVLRRSTPEVYRQIIKRSVPEVFKRIVGETPPEFVGRKVFRNVSENYRWTALPNGPEIFRPVLLESGPSVFETRTDGCARLVERRGVFVRRETDTFVRETWTRNHILYRLFRQKHGTEPETKEAALLPEGERPYGKRSVPERSGHSSRRPEAEKAQGERDGETYVQSVLTPERTEGNPVIVYRSPARPGSLAGEPASAPALPGQVEGEDVFRAQTVTPGQARALGQAFSYEAPERRREERGQLPADGVPPLRAEESINYNRLTEEILVRLERRLRAERRKFGL
ncbi:hypothetical protein N510_001968 [Firmicutes bacterium ASF500]|nr:hypothetical protein N510_001968 [Firmicutes bacterium ASF500]